MVNNTIWWMMKWIMRVWMMKVTVLPVLAFGMEHVYLLKLKFWYIFWWIVKMTEKIREQRLKVEKTRENGYCCGTKSRWWSLQRASLFTLRERAVFASVSWGSVTSETGNRMNRKSRPKQRERKREAAAALKLLLRALVAPPPPSLSLSRE